MDAAPQTIAIFQPLRLRGATAPKPAPTLPEPIAAQKFSRASHPSPVHSNTSARPVPDPMIGFASLHCVSQPFLDRTHSLKNDSWQSAETTETVLPPAQSRLTSSSQAAARKIPALNPAPSHGYVPARGHRHIPDTNTRGIIPPEPPSESPHSSPHLAP